MTINHNTSKALILTGFHRSATSATANYLSNAGLNMGYELMSANINNPKGYFEDIPVVLAHENEFKKAGTNWQFHDEVTLKVEDDFLSEYVTHRSNKDRYWGVKDPRICLFLEDWNKALGSNGHFFFIARHWSSCIESLLNRHSKSLAYELNDVTFNSIDLKFWTQPDLAAKMWLSYNKRLVSFVKQHPEKTIISTQRALFEGASILEAINHKFSFELNTSAKSPFDESLFRDVSNVTIFESISYSLQQELNQVWSEILALSEFKTKNEEPNIYHPIEISRTTLDKVQEYSDKKNYEVQCLGLVPPSLKSASTDWLTRLKMIDNAPDVITFINKTNPIILSEINSQDWLNHIESVFLEGNDIQSPLCDEVIFSTIKLLMRLREYDLAIVQLKNRIEIPGCSPFFYMFLAQCYQELNEFNLSDSLFKKAIGIKPNKGIFHTNYAILLAKYYKYDLAKYHFNIACKLEPSNASCVIGYCKFLERINKTTEAIDILDSFLDNLSHPMINDLLIKIKKKVDNKSLMVKYLSETRDRIDKANLNQWLAKLCVNLSYSFTERDLIQRCLQHWNNISKKKCFLGLITRCKDEYFISEFANYYLNEGVDYIYIIDDNSNNKGVYDQIRNNPKIKIIYENDIINENYASKLYKEIKNLYEWIIYVDVDEFITSKKRTGSTIRDELENHFSNADCIKVPWVMMSSNNAKKSPSSILKSNVWRWNHDKKHPSEVHKFRCRYEKIEVKCIFRTNKFDDITDHHPKDACNDPYTVDSILNKSEILNPFYHNLREADISEAILVCYHYRVISQENNVNKLLTNHWYIKQGYQLNDLYSSDHAEVFDNSMSVKQYKDKIFIIGFNRCGTRTLHYFFKENGLPSIHWDNDNLVKTIERNLNAGTKPLAHGCTVNHKVNSDCYYEKAQVFSDITYHPLNKDAKDYYKVLDRYYPNSKFILNIRNVDDWIASRKKHSNGKIVEQLCQFHSCSPIELENLWRNMWRETLDEIKKYFSDRPEDLLIFDINSDKVESITEFFKEQLILDPKHYKYVK